ncbi:MAG: c-type cytochrome domain-containing protein [Bacteroidia bacterium]|nr:c-type cytochrome domain-containing protein [Bacteroidia bacterium]
MSKAGYIIRQVAFVCQILILFLLFFEEKVEVPLLLQPLGRLHPLLLHLPIGFLVLLGFLEVIKKEFSDEAFCKLRSILLHVIVLTTSVSALMGFFLSREGGYGADMMDLHKWTGVGLSFLAYGLLYVDQLVPKQKWIYPAGLISSLVLLIFAGHFGASLTHGEDFVWAPLQEEEVQTYDPEAPAYQTAIYPILEAKCVTCHKEEKSKGDLIMTSVEAILKGGEEGPIWEAGDTENSLIVQRMLLPVEEKKHMPPRGKSQLEPMDIALISAWISEGADMEKPLKAFEEQSEFAALAEKKIDRLYASQEKAYSFEFASDRVVEEINTPFLTLGKSSYDSPALFASFYVAQEYDPLKLEELSKVKEQLVSLNLMNMPVGDEVIPTISQFANLEKLNLNGTNVSGAKLSELAKLPKLKSLALSSTAVDVSSLQSVLPQFQKLEEVFLWNTSFKTEDFQGLQESYPAIAFYQGFLPDNTERLKLSMPSLLNKKSVLASTDKVRFKNSFPGSQMRYTIDGSDPDSSSTLYEGPFGIEGVTEVRVREFMENWESSDVASFTFFPRGKIADASFLTFEPNPKYKGNGAQNLQDGEKGEAGNFTAKEWLGYQDSPFGAVFKFDQPTELSRLSLSYALNSNVYIMAPTSVEIWGGKDENSLQLLKKHNLPRAKDYEPNRVAGIDLAFDPVSYTTYKVVAKPLNPMPSWHRGAGDKGWVFVDEVFLY